MIETGKKYKFRYTTKKTKTKSRKALVFLLVSITFLVITLALRWDAIMESIPIYEHTVHKYLISNSDVHKCVPYKNLMIYCSKTGIAAIDKKGLEKWRINEKIDNPIISVSDDFITVSSKGGKIIYNIDGNGKYQAFVTEAPIENIKTGQNGYIAALVDEKNYNGSVIVYNRMGIPLFRWAAGTFNLVDASISVNGRKLAVSVIDTLNSQINGSILLFDINTNNSQYAQKTYENNMISSVKWVDNKTIIAVGDKKLSVLDDIGNEKWSYKFEDSVLNFFNIKYKNNIVLVTGSSSLDRQMMVRSFNIKGKLLGEYQYEGNIKNISTTKNRILVSSLYEVVLVDKYGKKKAEKSSEKEIYGGYMYNSGSVFLDEGGFAEIFKMKRGDGE